MNINNNNRRGRGTGRGGRSPGRMSRRPGSGKNPPSNKTTKTSNMNNVSTFFSSFGIDTDPSTSVNKRSSAQRSPFEGGSAMKKPAPFQESTTNETADRKKFTTPTRATNDKINKNTNQTNTNTKTTRTTTTTQTNNPPLRQSKLNTTTKPSNDKPINTTNNTPTLNETSTKNKNTSIKSPISTTTSNRTSNEHITSDNTPNTSTDQPTKRLPIVILKDYERPIKNESITNITSTTTNTTVKQQPIQSTQSTSIIKDSHTNTPNDYEAGTSDSEQEEITPEEERLFLGMSHEEYETYKNLAGKDDYSIASTASGVDMEEEDAKADEQETWYDDEVQPNETQLLQEDSEMELVLIDDNGKEPSKTFPPVTESQEETKKTSNPSSQSSTNQKDDNKDNTPPTSTTSNPFSSDTVDNTHTKVPTVSNPTADEATKEDNQSLYKIINSRSRNRRVSNAVSNRSKTPDASNRTSYPQYTYKTRVTLKLALSASADPLKALQDIIKEFLREINNLDTSLSILPWQKNNLSAPIQANAALPNTITAMRKYFHKLYIPKKDAESTIYPQLMIGHENDFEILREGIFPWVQSNGHGFFYNMLQEEDGVEIGWLLYSTREMDAGALADEIRDAIKVNIGLRWKVISNGTKQLSKDNLVRALAIEVSAKKKWQSHSKLLQLYSRSIKQPKDYPNGIRLRFVKLKTSSVNHVEKSKLDKLRARQKSFLNTIISISTDEIIQLDYSSKGGQIPTLRQMIMNLKSGINDTPLFHCVDLDWRNEGFTFQCSTRMAEEAQTTIHTLLPLLQQQYPDAEVDTNFDENAIFRCQYMTWDEDKQMIVDLLAPEHTTEFGADENLSGFVFDMEAVTNETVRPIQNTVQDINPQDDDSVSTFRTYDVPSRAPNQTQLAAHRINSSSSVNSNNTMITTETLATMDSRITALASQVVANQNNNSIQFNAIMNALNNLSNHSNGNNPSPGQSSQAGNHTNINNNAGSGQGL